MQCERRDLNAGDAVEVLMHAGSERAYYDDGVIIFCDGHLNDDEARFLHNWLSQNQSIATAWPGDVIYARVKAVLADGLSTRLRRLAAAHLER